MIYTISNIDKNIEWGLDGESRIVQNVLNIIRTRKYEVPFMTDLGLDANHTDNAQLFLQMQIKDEIVDLVEKFESRARVVDVIFKEVDNDGSLTYEVELEV